jgi:hypothetical protein
MTMCEIDYIYTCKPNKKKTIGQTKQKIQYAKQNKKKTKTNKHFFNEKNLNDA